MLISIYQKIFVINAGININFSPVSGGRGIDSLLNICISLAAVNVNVKSCGKNIN